jgi:hypothetical protein
MIRRDIHRAAEKGKFHDLQCRLRVDGIPVGGPRNDMWMTTL